MEKSGPILLRLFSLRGKVALITGASSGIGRELASGLAEVGAIVCVHGRDTKKIEESCREVEARGGKALPFTAELSDIEACRGLIGDVHAALGSIDVLVNCAATNRRKPISEVTS